MTGIGNFSPGQQICGLHDICSSHTLCHVKPLVCSQRLGTGCGHRGGHHSVYHKVFLPFWNLRNVSELELACSGVFWDSGTQWPLQGDPCSLSIHQLGRRCVKCRNSLHCMLPLLF
jgi:hypothetical protein